MSGDMLAEDAPGVIAMGLDAAFYVAAYPDILDAGMEPLSHYIRTGWIELRDPAPWFSTRAYLSDNPDVARAGHEPFHHYLSIGFRQGRQVRPSALAESYFLSAWRAQKSVAWSYEPQPPKCRSSNPPAATPELPPADPHSPTLASPGGLSRAERDLVAAEFDEAYYKANYQDVAAAGMDGLEHFLVTGWREGRNPNAKFSVRDYLETYVDIVQADVNPFLHYVRTGRAEGRIARNQLGFRYQIIADLVPVADRVAACLAHFGRGGLGSAEELRQGLRRSRTGLRDLHITFSHDDYTAHTGGVQLCLQREGARLNALGCDHLHIYPAAPWPVVRIASEAGQLGVLLNGAPVGIFSADVISQALEDAAGAVTPGRRSFAIHSLLGHAARETILIIEAAGLSRGFFWLHDFASVCAGVHLLRNDVEDCGAPPPESAACNICVYGVWRRRHQEEHQELFERLLLTVVSPAQVTLDLWLRAANLPNQGQVVLPHAKLVERCYAPKVAKARPFRLAFAGMPVSHKGWPIFRDLVLRHAEDPRYEFFHVGGREDPGLPIKFRHVVVTDAHPRAMQEALEAVQADAVLLWPLCRETFSFAAYEAVASGAAVITGPDSGNVAAMVRSAGHGEVMKDEASLAQAFESGEIIRLSRSRRDAMLFDLEFSSLTLDLLGERWAL